MFGCSGSTTSLATKQTRSLQFLLLLLLKLIYLFCGEEQTDVAYKLPMATQHLDSLMVQILILQLAQSVLTSSTMSWTVIACPIISVL